jgi:hypothetical protein
LIGDDPIGVGVRSLPVGFGIIAGAVIALVAIPVTKGRIRALMIVFTAVMTGATGAMAIATPYNLNAVYAVLMIASIGVGGVIIPCTIIAQIACPDDHIATITAITLSIRYIGGAIGYGVYTNVFFHRITENLTKMVALQTLAAKFIVNVGSPTGIATLTHITELIGKANIEEVKTIFATSADVLQRDQLPMVLIKAREAFALAYKWPYYISIFFGGACFILSFFLGDLGPLLDGHIANPTF